MKIRIVMFLFISCIVLPRIVLSQQFYFKCFFHKFQPQMYFVPPDNIFDNTNNNRISLVKDSDSSAYIILKPSKISFFKIGGDPVFIMPGEHVEGDFIMSQFHPYDSNTVNFKLRKISEGFSAILNNYPIESDFENFKTVFVSLKHYVDSMDDVLNKTSGHGMIQGWNWL